MDALGDGYSEDQAMHVVCLGASAGGLAPLKAFFGAVGNDSPHVYVIVQHLSNKHVSRMAEILRTVTPLPIATITDGTPLASGTVYLLPANANAKLARIDDQLHFKLATRPRKPELNLPVDVFFASLAQHAGIRGIAVVLSGSGSDGSHGLVSVKSAGGVVICQDPDEAEFSGMPQSAINSGVVDLVLGANDIPTAIKSYTGIAAAEWQTLERTLEKDYARVTELLQTMQGADEVWETRFIDYKRPMVCRRIAKRMRISGVETIEQYRDFIANHPQEADALASELLINVTAFFRDPLAWRTIESDTLPGVIGDGTREARLWSAGCCTGEEAFTLSMLCAEYCDSNNIPRNYKIFATDLDEKAVEQASRGFYPSDIAEQLSADRLARHFTRRDGGYRVADRIRRRVMFSRHDLIDSPAFVHIDLLVCRNLLIYFDTSLQERIIDKICFALRPGGVLFLGRSESLGSRTGYFHPLNRQHRIFRNTRRRPTFPRPSTLLPAVERPLRPTTSDSPSPRVMVESNAQAMLRALLGEFNTSCALIVDSNCKLIETAGHYRRFLNMPDDGFASNLLHLVPKASISAVELCIRRLRNSYGTDQASDVSTRIAVDTAENQGYAHASFRAIPPGDTDPAERFVIVLTLEEDADSSNEEESSVVSRTTMELMQQELIETQEYLKNAINELETSNEELQSTNEELMSSNEELQSTYEELQSTNEELYSVNAKHQSKIDELDALNADINSLLESSNIATVFLDRNGAIRKFTPAIQNIFDLKDSDRGRALLQFVPKLGEESKQAMEAAIQSVLHGDSDLQEFEGRLRTKEWLRIRVGPHYDSSGLLDGVAVTFVDINTLKTIESELSSGKLALESVLDSTLAGYWDWRIQDGHGRISKRFRDMFGYGEDELPNELSAWQKLVHPEDEEAATQAYERHVASKGKEPYDLQLRYFHKDGSIVWVLCRGRIVEWSSAGEPLRMLGSHIDITPLRQAQEVIQQRAEESRQMAYIASHDLREPLNSIRGLIGMLKDSPDDTELSAEVLSRIDTSAEHLANMVEGLLTFSRLDEPALELEALDLSEIVASVIADMRTSLDDVGADITIKPMPTIRGSDALIRQMFSNLIWNAAKFHRDGVPPAISIEAAFVHSAIHIRVTDNGIGIAKEHIDRVFALFRRLHTRSEFQGSGIGLSICQKIARLHGGDIWVDSELGVGSTFTISLPVRA
ncbi:MAG: CheR family methyltransferase [Pseudomonadota bacterium]